MTVDVLSGWSETVGDSSPIWAIADRIAGLAGAGAGPTVRRHTCGTDLSPFLQWPGREASGQKRLWIVYSYGCARLWQCLCQLKAGSLTLAVPFDHLVIIAGVPRFWDGQFEISDDQGVWHIDPQVFRAATCFSPRDFCMPQSQPIKNPSAVFENRFVPCVNHASIVSAVAGDVVQIAQRLFMNEVLAEQ